MEFFRCSLLWVLGGFSVGLGRCWVVGVDYSWSLCALMLDSGV